MDTAYGTGCDGSIRLVTIDNRVGNRDAARVNGAFRDEATGVRIVRAPAIMADFVVASPVFPERGMQRMIWGSRFATRGASWFERVEVGRVKSLLVARFGDHVRALRKQATLTQAMLAKRSGLSVDSVRRIERGAFSPSLDSIAKLCMGLGISIARFFDAFDHPESGLPNQIAGALRGRSPSELQMVWRVVRAILGRGDERRESTPRGRRKAER